MADRTCRICGGVLSDTTYHREGSAQRCCSMDCLRLHWRAKAAARSKYESKAPKPCATCGELTTPKPGRGRNNKYCSRRCREVSKNTSPLMSPIVVADCVDCGAAHVTRPNTQRRRCPPCHAIHLRHKKRSSGARYRARKRNARTEVFANVDVYERDGWRCGLCGKPIDRNLAFPHPKSVSLDHIIPLSRGGEHSMANTQASHYECNMRKNNGVLVPEQLRLIG